MIFIFVCFLWCLIPDYLLYLKRFSKAFRERNFGLVTGFNNVHYIHANDTDCVATSAKTCSINVWPIFHTFIVNGKVWQLIEKLTERTLVANHFYNWFIFSVILSKQKCQTFACLSLNVRISKHLVYLYSWEHVSLCSLKPHFHHHFLYSCPSNQ